MSTSHEYARDTIRGNAGPTQIARAQVHALLAIADAIREPQQVDIAQDRQHLDHGTLLQRSGGLTPQQRGDLLGVTRADIRAPHGTRSRYIGSRRWPGCRCDDCHAAHAAYERAQRARRKAARAAGAR